MTIKLRFCEVEFTDWGAQTRFQDGTFVNAAPHDTTHYAVIAHRLGYGDDILAYCQEHEFFHSFICERLLGEPSLVLWNLARERPTREGLVVVEEIATQAMQRWVRAHERPIVAYRGDWDALKREAIELLAGQRESGEIPYPRS